MLSTIREPCFVNETPADVATKACEVRCSYAKKKKIQNYQQMHFGVMSAVLLYSDHRHVSATHMAVFSVESARIHIYLQRVGINALLKSYSFV